jgi:hypothetical protein
MSLRRTFWQRGFTRNVTAVSLSLAFVLTVAGGYHAYRAASYVTPSCPQGALPGNEGCSVKADHIFTAARFTLGGFAAVFGGLTMIGFGQILRPRP